MTTNKVLLFFYILLILNESIEAQNVPPYVPTNGLIGWWPFNGNATEVVTNVSPNLNSASLTQDRFSNANSAYSFNGSNIIRYGGVTPLSLIGNNFQNFTINFWIKPSSVGHVLGAFGWGYFIIWNQNRSFQFNYVNGGNWSSLATDSNLAVNQWHMVTLTRSGSALSFYLNTTLNKTSNSLPTMTTYSHTNSWFGGNGQDNNSFVTATIDDIGIWSRALSESEIGQLYQVQDTSTVSENNIGINLTSPQRSLHVKDIIRLEPRTTSPNNPAKGDMYFDAILNKLRVFDGTQWQNCW
jgi:hypothetical protein